MKGINSLQLNNMFEQFINSLSDVVFVTDLKGIITFFNKRAEKLLGYESQHLVNKVYIESIFAPNELSNYAQMLSKEFNKNFSNFDSLIAKVLLLGIDENEWIFISKQGERIAVKLSISVLSNEKGGIAGFIGVAKDVSWHIEEVEKQFSLLLEMFCVIGKDGYFKRLNPSFEKLLGYSLAELYSKPCIDFIHPDDKEKTSTIINRINGGEEINYFENRYVCKDRSCKWLAWHTFNIRTKSKPTDIYAIVHNITEQKRVHNELETLSLVASKTNNSVIIVDKNGYVEWVNDGFTRLTGYLQLEVLGKTPEEILQGPVPKPTTGIKTTSIRKPFNEKIQGYSKTGKPYWVSTSITPTFDEAGDIDRFIIIETDITKQHLIENKILENEARLSGIINSAMDGIITFDSNHQILVFNSSSERIFLCPTKYALGQQIDTFLPELTKYKGLATLSSILDNITGVRSNNEEFPVEATMSQVDLGKEKLYTIILRDITDRRLSEKKLKEYAKDLEKINTELDQFAYVVSHDLKAPLRAISHLSEWLEEDLENLLTSDTTHKMTLLRNRVNRMEALIDGILKYSRIGRTQFIGEEVDVGKLITEIIEDLDPLPKFSFEIQKEMPVFVTEKIALSQVFSNLISNAIKYHHQGKGYIEIGVKEKEDFYYQFSVKDNGLGIDSRYHEKIFIIFQTLEARDKIESTGVGLAIVKKIVESQGGSVWLESEVGRGTTFYFTWLDSTKKQKHQIDKSSSRIQKPTFLSNNDSAKY